MQGKKATKLEITDLSCPLLKLETPALFCGDLDKIVQVLVISVMSKSPQKRYN